VTTFKNKNSKTGIKRTIYLIGAGLLLASQISCQKIKYIDGVYEGEYSKTVKTKVKVTVENTRIKDIELIDYKGWRDHDASVIIPQRIIKKQNPRVDIITGATESSEVIMTAVERALDGAKLQ